MNGVFSSCEEEQWRDLQKWMNELRKVAQEEERRLEARELRRQIPNPFFKLVVAGSHEANAWTLHWRKRETQVHSCTESCGSAQSMAFPSSSTPCSTTLRTTHFQRRSRRGPQTPPLRTVYPCWSDGHVCPMTPWIAMSWCWSPTTSHSALGWMCALWTTGLPMMLWTPSATDMCITFAGRQCCWHWWIKQPHRGRHALGRHQGHP